LLPATDELVGEGLAHPPLDASVCTVSLSPVSNLGFVETGHSHLLLLEINGEQATERFFAAAYRQTLE
jgi:hypothetical protein